MPDSIHSYHKKVKKLIYIANARIPTEKAHGLAIMKMCEAFASAGVDVRLLVPRRSNLIKEDPFNYYDVKKVFSIKKLPTIDLVFLGKFGFFIQSLSFAKFAFLYCVFRKKVDIIYGRDELSLFFLSLFKRNIVWEAHTAKANWIVRTLLKRSRAIVVISQGLKDYYVSLGTKPEKILVAHSGVDLSVFENIKESKEELRKKLGLPLDKRIVAYVGKRKSMGEDKGVEELERTFDSFVEENPEVYPLIVSEVSPRKVPLYMKAVDVLVMNYPNIEHYAKYMSPLKMFEYMASGTPIVTSDIPTVREVLDESMATFFKPNDFDGLRNSIIEVLQNPSGSEKKAQKAKEEVQRCTWDNRAERVLSFLNIENL